MLDPQLFIATDGLPAFLSGPALQDAMFQKPEKIVGDWLCKGSLAMVYGATGIGKSWFSLTVAASIANGQDAFGWEVPSKRKVVYFDAEIDPYDTQNRIKGLSPSGVPDELALCSGIRLENGLPQLHEPEAQEAYLEVIEEQGAEVVVFDNLCSIVTSGSISDDDVWLPIQPFLNKLRQRGIAVIIVHHAGKTGDYLGSSRMTQNLDTVIKLEKPQSHDLQNGAVFSIRFEKGRAVFGDAATGVFAKLVQGPEGELEWDLGELSSRDRSEEAMNQVVDAMRSKKYE
ncbi:AAA domain-containing protein [Hoeflea halophila]|uniref:AAA domain-containing protein n=2 Tax=Hoeflea halophila TaxID=714899 RepID=A0A286IEM8_9HYPH|nr:AAA domain-containing protein [Hoeflea halophila]